MPGFFEAMANLQKKKDKVHTVTIQGQSVVVTLEKKLEVMKHGESAYMWKSETEFVLKPRPKSKTAYPVLVDVAKGYHFQDNDIHWPNEIGEKGKAWLIESE